MVIIPKLKRTSKTTLMKHSHTFYHAFHIHVIRH